MTPRRLVADVGGTNVRFARTVAGRGTVEAVRRYEVRAFASFPDAVARYLSDTGTGAPPGDMAIGAAGPVDEGRRVALTNAPWSIDADDLAGIVDPSRVRIVNDLQSVALLLPWLGAGDVAFLRGALSCDASGAARPTPRLAVNVGTGFGAAVAQPVLQGRGDPPVWHAFATEAGHMTAGTAGLDPAPGERLASIEDALSGSGVVRLARERAGGDGAFATASDVFSETSPQEIRTALAARLGMALGMASRNLVLAHAAWGGVFLVGSVARALVSSGDDARAAFLAGFDTHPDGPMATRLTATPIALVTRDSPELAGLSYLPIPA